MLRKAISLLEKSALREIFEKLKSCPPEISISKTMSLNLFSENYPIKLAKSVILDDFD